MPLETVTEGFLSSKQQQALWRAGSLRPLGALFELLTPVDPDDARTAVQRLMQRHEILRTRVLAGPSGDPIQVIQPRADDSFHCIATDLETLELAQSQSSVRPFAATLWTSTRNGRQWLELQAHPLNADLRSLQLIAEEFARELADGAVGEVAIQHADYAAWQEERDKSSDAPKLEEGGEAASISLPFEGTGSGGTGIQTVRQQLSAEMRGIEPMRWRALWASYLGRVAGSSVVPLLVMQNGRTEPELKRAVGPYDVANAIEVQILPDATLAQMEEAVRSARPCPRNGVRFGIETHAGANEQGHLRQVDASGELPGEGLTALIRVDEGGLQLLFDSALIHREAADRFLDGFATFTREAAGRPEQALALAPIVGANERQSLLRTFHGPRVTFDLPEGIERWIEQAAAKNPDGIAVRCGGRELTCRELEERSNQLARSLRARGVTENSLVGLAAKRSIETIVGIVGILKSGGAYVPLDPGYPPARLEMMIREAGLRWIAAAPGASIEAHDAQIIPLDFNGTEFASQSMEKLESNRDPHRLAYLIFTSGSTGKPKAVTLSHRALLHSTHARFQTYDDPVRNYLLVSSFSFDSSVAGIFWTLCQGGTLTLPEEGLHQDPDALAGLIEQTGATHFLALPSLYAAVLDRTRNASSLRAVLVAGEACSPELLAQHRRKAPHAALYNEYGPTEAAVWSTVYRCDHAQPGRTVPIGKPIPNCQIFVVDAHMQLCPIGVPGELLVGGPGLAEGYLHHPELTDSKFIPNPFTPEDSRRLYRTGDLVRLLPDGNLEFHGRIDAQVKIRGHRVELGEIEARLREQPGVKDAIVIARDDASGGKQLVAYLARNGQAPDSRAIRQALLKTLPEHMAPTAYVALDAFPLNPNGKVDRKALPAPEVAAPREQKAAGELTDAQRKVCELMAATLKLPRVNLEDDFFELGGHSLLAMQLIAKLRDAFAANVPLRVIFESRTASGIAEAVEKSPRAASGSGGIKRVRRGVASTGISEKPSQKADATRLPL